MNEKRAQYNKKEMLLMKKNSNQESGHRKQFCVYTKIFIMIYLNYKLDAS